MSEVKQSVATYEIQKVSDTISEVKQSLETCEIQKGINLLGLKLSECELNELQLGNTISLEGRRLGEIGSVFILAEALSAANSVKNITYQDLPEAVRGFSSCSGAPIYYWNSDLFGKCCLVLTIVDGKPAIRISSQD